jgi:hypothetical protein
LRFAACGRRDADVRPDWQDDPRPRNKASGGETIFLALDIFAKGEAGRFLY